MIYVDGTDPGVTQALRIVGVMSEADKGLCVPVVSIQSAQGACPDYSLLIDGDGLNITVEDGTWVLGIVAEYLELIPIVAVEAILGGQPNESSLVLKDGAD